MKTKITYLIAVAVLAFMACSCNKIDDPAKDAESGGEVLLTAGCSGLATKGDVVYLPQDARFTCRMYYCGTSGSDVLDSEAQTYMKVRNELGNSVYWTDDFSYSGSLDDKLNHPDAPILYWQNRNTHVFVALSDFNSYASLEAEDLEMDTDEDFKTYSLAESDGVTRMAMQPDPIKAYVSMKPTGATPEANRVNLVFQHQLSQVQVSLKGAQDGSSGNLTAANILSVDLLGTSTEAYVYTTALSTDVTKSKLVLTSQFTDAQLEQNPYGTSFRMFTADETEYGYLKTFEAIAFGSLEALRIRWSEPESGTVHEVVFPTQSLSLVSGTRYVYNLELRRGVLAVINADIKDWKDTGHSFSTEGSIDND